MKTSSLKIKLVLAFTKYFTWIIVIVIILILSLGYYLFVKDVVSDIQRIGSTDMSGRQNVLSQRQATLGELEDLYSQYRVITSEEIGQINEFIPSQDEIPFVMIEIKNFIEANDLVLTNIDSGPLSLSAKPEAAATGIVSQPGSLKRLNITLVISGIDSYPKMKDFLYEMSTQLPLLELNSLAYNPGISTYSLNLTTFYK